MHGVDGLLSTSGDTKLALRLSQLHTFFSCHQPSYREQWTIPDPPAALILKPQQIQVHIHTFITVLKWKEKMKTLFLFLDFVPAWSAFVRSVPLGQHGHPGTDHPVVQTLLRGQYGSQTLAHFCLSLCFHKLFKQFFIVILNMLFIYSNYPCLWINWFSLSMNIS